jgi:predicted transcriptional regulator
LDIIADILDAVRNDAKKTHIMFQANLSYSVLQRYLAEVINASLVTLHDEKQYYSLTDKGLEFLLAYKEYNQSTQGLEKRLSFVDSKRKRLTELCPDNTEL